ncbi:cell wall glucanase [Delitschia confertaspora ATCC 74209]|uniref:Crh-like protein n=1 Tax=Delitschia confertaspora ATCC 74209 TaxID=1513339 RepID=A0A9P4MWV7_9PLEO|nr:cell wall glucanase [Delitschia confertaspora ATCC 74209]
MVRNIFFAATLAATFSSAVLAAGGASCGPGKACPAEAPCCSQYGVCGVGAYCLGGCDPLFSHQLDSCVPNPTCKSTDYKLKSLDDVISIDKYLGDPDKANWVSQGKPIIYKDSILLTMAEGTVGTLLESTHYVWYGNICATMTTSQGAGVVTAFIMMSNVKDEIDFEFIGVDTVNAQSNFYSQGVTNYNNGRNLTVGNTVEKPHEYCIDWKPDELKWLIDGEEKRTLKKEDTWNATSNRFDYPQTPSRVMLSLWPAGLPTNAKGTIDWAGGEISWNSPFMQNGYYYATVSEVKVECYDPPSGAKKSGNKAYKYTDKAGTNDTVEMVGDLVILSSLYASGEDPKNDPYKVEPSKSSSGKAKPTPTVETIPGGIQGGGRVEEQPSSTNAGVVQETASNGGDGQPRQTAPASNNPGNFDQGLGGGNGGKSDASLGMEPALGMRGGSALAVVVAVLGLVVL